jgi:gamma-glutamyl-gamma-aminobutyrate hydrolase PuuD
MPMTEQDRAVHRPRIVVTLAAAGDHAQPDLAARRNDLYVAALARHGAEPVRLDVRSPAAVRENAFLSMDGLLLSGGTDIHPSRYGRSIDGSREIEPDRDELEATAWAVADSRQVPVLGICRGIQAINVFSGGSILQNVEGHAGPTWVPARRRCTRYSSCPAPGWLRC